MSEEMIISLLGLGGSAIGSLVGIVVNSRMMSYRVEQLEKKVEMHNNLIDRMYGAEKKINLLEEKQAVANHRISDAENDISKLGDRMTRRNSL